MKKINLEAIFKNNFNNMDCFIDYDKSGLECIKKSMLDFGKQLLELAIENVKIKKHTPSEEDDRVYNEIDKESITNTINQVDENPEQI